MNLPKNVNKFMFSVQAPDPEQRALFIATVSNIDWPTSGYDSTADQRNQMLDYLDRIANMNMNTVVFQVCLDGMRLTKYR